MAKFNVVQKKKRAQSQERKRRIHGDPVSGKLKLKEQPVSISGKRKRKLLKKWRRVRPDPTPPHPTRFNSSLCYVLIYLFVNCVMKLIAGPERGCGEGPDNYGRCRNG
jgi:hypothetical protein